MELRSGVVTGGAQPEPAAGGASSSGVKVDPRWCLIPQKGDSHGDLEPGPFFESGIAALMNRWTALRLAVDNGWGGRDGEEKYLNLQDEILEWFYKGKGALYADELEDILMEAMRVDFNTECEDESPKEVSVKMVQLYTECAKGNYAFATELTAKKGTGTNKSVKVKKQRTVDGQVQRQTVGDDENADDSDSSDSEEDEDGPPTWTHGTELPVVEEEKPAYVKPEKVIDEDGFETVQPRRRKR